MGRITHDTYQPAVELISLMKLLCREENYKYTHLGTSARGKQLAAVVTAECDSQKPMIMFEAGISGREWITSAALVYFLTELPGLPAHHILRTVDFIFVPLLNPDGYQYSTVFDKNWIKNRNDTETEHCVGVNINRNFEYEWGKGAEGVDPCSQIYRGPTPWSEEETKLIRQLVCIYKSRILLYLSIRSPLQSILYPWSHTKARPPDAAELQTIAWHVREYIRLKYLTEYNIGQWSWIAQEVPGSSIDWVKHEGGIKYTYTISLPGPQYDYNVPEQNIVRIGQELFDMVKIFCEIIKYGRIRHYRSTNEEITVATTDKYI